MDIANLIGDTGAACFLLAYALLQKGRVLHSGGLYLGLNLVGSILVMASLSVHWNFPAFLLEAAWALISMYGIYRHILRRKRP